jgi:hypothetical protein
LGDKGIKPFEASPPTHGSPFVVTKDDRQANKVDYLRGRVTMHRYAIHDVSEASSC